MKTYVINTSDNKTFDSDQLFRLAGYKKINWLNVHLDEVDKCIEYIKNRQGEIQSEEFRIAVLIDFFSFDKIRSPYGRKGYSEDLGVECSLYLPYIEGYLYDKLFYALEKKELFASGYEIFYIKAGKIEIIENLNNLKDQIDQIVFPVEDSFVDTRKSYIKEQQTVYVSSNNKIYTVEEYENINKEIEELNKRLYENLGEKENKAILDEIQEKIDYIDGLRSKQVEVKKIIEEKAYTSFELYCTPNMSLRFDIDEFPYVIDVNKKDGISTRQFFDAFCDRSRKNNRLRRYFYSTSLGGSSAKAAFENLALSLNLVRLYEREDEIKEDGGIVEVSAVDPEELKNLLLTAWNKIIQAKKIAKENNSLYFSLKKIYKKTATKKEKKKLTPEEEFSKERSKLVLPDDQVKDSIDKQYELIMSMGKKGDNIFIDKDKEEFDEILSKYLKKRNDVSEKEFEKEFKDRVSSNVFERTNQCPPRQEYDYVVGQKQDEISELMKGVLSAEYSAQKFETEKEAAKKYYEEYLSAKKILQRGTLGDIIFLLLTLLTVIVPYVAAKFIIGFNFGTIIVFALCSATFLGLFLLSFFIAILPSVKKMRKMKHLMLECYKDCLAKKKVALAELKNRYEIDLIQIEDCRYEIRQLTYLYQQNIKQDRNIDVHRHVLDDVENCLGTILNNLGIHPVIDDDISVNNEFNMLKSILSYENKVYKVFSLEAIESLLVKDKKGVI